MRKYFGTDGIRGEANKDLNIDLILNVGLAVGYYLKNKIKDRKPVILLGTDTRITGYLVRSALSTGLIAMGVNVEFVGVIPTPGVSYLTRKKNVDLGIMISASHNPIKDNGIKIFDSNGEKINENLQEELEKLIDDKDNIIKFVADAIQVGRFTFIEDDVKEYRHFLKSTVSQSFKGYKVVIDTANGASYRVASKVFQSLGAEVITINNTPNGKNINVDCGSTNTTMLREIVKISKANLGLAFDGDADRLIAVDDLGNEINGDKIIALIALYQKQKGYLNSNTIVTTILSNMGFEEFLLENQIKLIRSNVGDQYVLEKMKKQGLNIGGEQSGHIILFDYNTTGDGVLAGLQLMSLVVASGKKLSDLTKDIKLWPQKLFNLKLNNKKDSSILNDIEIIKYITKQQDEISKKGRILIRPSGTEPLIRIMVEAKDEKLIDEFGNKIYKYLEGKINHAQ